MQTAALSSGVPESKDHETIENLGLSGTTLMQLWAIGVATLSDLTTYNADSLRERLAESLNGTGVRERVEKTLLDVQSALRARHLELEGRKKETKSSASNLGPTRPNGKVKSLEEEKSGNVDDEVPRSERGPLWHFYQDVKRYGVLSKEEHLELGRRVLEEKDPKARDLLVLHNLRLVLWVARKQLWAITKNKRNEDTFELADLVQEGIIGLMIAAKKYDYRTDVNFSTYAVWWIRQSITRMIMDGGFIRIPVHLGEVIYKIRRAMNVIALREGRPPTMAEVAKETELEAGFVKKALKAAQMQIVSLDEVISAKQDQGFEDDHERYEFIADETSLRADHVLEAREELDAACNRLNRLTDVLYEDESIADKNRKIFVRFYGLDGSLKKRTLEHVAEGYDVTRERVRQIIASCWNKLQLTGLDMDHESVVEELIRIRELEKLAGKRVSAG